MIKKYLLVLFFILIISMPVMANYCSGTGGNCNDNSDCQQ